jgi:hypothetical protein
MTRCPLCAAAWQTGAMRCDCGYDELEVSKRKHERDQWRMWRNQLWSIAGLGFLVLLVGPAVSIGLAAAAGGVLTSVGFVGGAWTSIRVRSMNRQLRAARTPKQLPQARIV